jgi:acyl-CoA thioesterase-1
VWERGGPRVPMNRTVRALGDVQEAALPARLLFVGPPAVDESGQNDRLELLDHELRLEAGRLGVPFISTFNPTLRSATWLRQVREGDGFHPNAEGYAALAEGVVEPILDWLASPGPDTPRR